VVVISQHVSFGMHDMDIKESNHTWKIYGDLLKTGVITHYVSRRRTIILIHNDTTMHKVRKSSSSPLYEVIFINDMTLHLVMTFFNTTHVLKAPYCTRRLRSIVTVVRGFADMTVKACDTDIN